MTKKERQLAKILAASGVALCISLSGTVQHATPEKNPMAFVLGASVSLAPDGMESMQIDTGNPVHRIALRLRRRLLQQGIPAPFSDAVAATTERRRLLASYVHVSVFDRDGNVGKEWTVGPQRYPLWISIEAKNGHVATVLAHEQMVSTIEQGDLPMLEAPVGADLTELVTAGGITKAVTSATAKPGYVLHAESVAQDLGLALNQGITELPLTPAYVAGELRNESGRDLGELQLIGSGQSNFAGSPSGRDYNVRKALREHLHNVVVEPGAEFSFNATLGGPVSERRGWRLAKVISAGDLVMEPGGGICQTSTTLYRGVLQAGFPIGKRKSHSMYVSYYEKGGVGLDATVYYGQQDLTFTNDTAHPVLIQAYDDGSDAFVQIYGTPDGRKTKMDGPYFSGNVPQEFIENGRGIRANEIGWLQRIERPDGVVTSVPILSSYKALPKSIIYKYTAISAR